MFQAEGYDQLELIIRACDEPEVNADELDRLRRSATELEDLASRASRLLRAHLETVAAVTDDYVTAALEGRRTTYTKVDLQGAGYSITDVCRRHLS